MTRVLSHLLALCLVMSLEVTAFEYTPTLPSITDKTLVVWCMLDDLDQRGGSVLTLEKDDVFDGIVYGEIAPRRWMAGSDHLKRSPQEQAVVRRERASRDEMVQLAAVFRGNTVTLYRNGVVLMTYEVDTPAKFGSGSKVIIGLRHEAARGWENAHFDGRVEEARLYNVALSTEEIEALQVNVASAIEPLGWWTFEEDSTRDQMGNFPDGELFGGARVRNGLLWLDGRDDFMATPSLIDFSDGLRFAPEGTIFGDAIPYYWDGVYHVYYLRAPGWGHIASRDLVHWEERPHALMPSPERTAPDGQDCWTGSIVHHEGVFHLFYTGKNDRDPLGDQKVMVATSTDLDSWTKQPDRTFYADGKHYWSMPINGNEDGRLNAHHMAFRDPEVFWNEEAAAWWLLLHAALPDGSMAVFALYTSEDLINWTPQDPIHTYPLSVSGDCPNILKMNGRWYIIAAEHHYIVAASPGGPYEPEWITYDTGDLRVPKTMFDGERRLLVGWIRDRAGYVDDGQHGWGGIMSMPRELYADENGQLYQRPPNEVIAAFAHRAPNTPTLLTVDEQIETPPDYLLQAELHAAGAATIRFRHTPEDPESGYHLTIDYTSNEVSIGSSHETYRRTLPLESGTPLSLRLFVVGTAAECFVNDRHAFTLRMFDHRDGQLSLDGRDGDARLDNLSLRTMK